MLDKPTLAIAPETFNPNEILASPRKTVVAMIALAVVISIVLFLLFLLFQTFNSRTDVSRLAENENLETENVSELDSRRIDDINNLKAALERFMATRGFYPSSLISLTPNYIFSIPVDPKTGRDYDYRASIDQESFELSTRLESGREYLVTND